MSEKAFIAHTVPVALRDCKRKSINSSSQFGPASAIEGGCLSSRRTRNLDLVLFIVWSSTGFRLLHFDQVRTGFEAEPEGFSPTSVEEDENLGSDIFRAKESGASPGAGASDASCLLVLPGIRD